MTKTYLYDKLQTLFFDYIHTTFHCVVRKRRKQKIWYQKEKRVAEGKSLVHTWIFSRRRSTPYYYFFLKEICTFLFLLFVGKEELFLLSNYFCIHKYMLYLQYIDTNKQGVHWNLFTWADCLERSMHSDSDYRTSAIITRGLYTFYPLFEVQKRFFKGFFS